MATRRQKKNTLHFGLSKGEEEFLGRSTVTVDDGDARSPLIKSLINQLNGPEGSIERLAFEVSPNIRNNFGGVYRAKLRLVPDDVLKRIAVQDSLVSNIIRARQNHMSSFGRPRSDRFALGFIIQPQTGIIDKLDEKEKQEFTAQIKKAAELINTCGYTEGVPEEKRSTFSEYLSLSVRSALVCGRIATEIVQVDTGDGDKKAYRWVNTDSGTIYRAATDQAALRALRQDAFFQLENLLGKDDLKREPRDEKAEFTWVQVIDGKPVQAFTTDEMKVYNFYAVPDVELDGYPVTPIDTVITAITTHINIVTHNKMYFQSGRASRGMLVIKSDDVDPEVTSSIKQAFNASINNVSNSWRMPVFGCGTDEEITWQPIDSAGGKDMEFQYLTDLNAREILTAFMMSPDELPGWSYLSRGTASQSLSEGNNEYKLEAARDVGIRPLLHQFEDFINTHLLPLIDTDLAKKARVKLVGLDADNAEKEAVRLQQDMAIWETPDGILERVEKKPLGKKWGGNIILNPAIQAVWANYFTVGEILENFCDREGASKDPTLAYRPNQWWFQWQQMLQAQQQAQQQAQAQAAGAAQPGGGGGPQGGGSPQGGAPGGPGDGSDSGSPTPTENQKSQQVQEASPSGGMQGQGAGQQGGQGDASDLARSIDTAFDFLSKSEQSLPPEQRRQLHQQRTTVDRFMRGWLEDLPDAVNEIMAVVRHHAPKPKGN
jgi:Phage portal protein